MSQMGFAPSWAETGEGWMPQSLAPPGPPGGKSLPRQICPQKCQQPLDTNAAPTTWGHTLTAPHRSCSSNKGVEPRCSTASCCSTAEQALLYSNFWFWEKKIGTIPTSWGHLEMQLRSRALGRSTRAPQTRQPWQYYNITIGQQPVIY